MERLCGSELAPRPRGRAWRVGDTQQLRLPGHHFRWDIWGMFGLPGPCIIQAHPRPCTRSGRSHDQPLRQLPPGLACPCGCCASSGRWAPAKLQPKVGQYAPAAVDAQGRALCVVTEVWTGQQTDRRMHQSGEPQGPSHLLQDPMGLHIPGLVAEPRPWGGAHAAGSMGLSFLRLPQAYID